MFLVMQDFDFAQI